MLYFEPMHALKRHATFQPCFIEQGTCVGAADCVSSGMAVIDLFHLAIDLTKNNKCRFGQIIYEKNPATGAEWVHFGGDPGYVFSEEIVKFLNRIQFMQSLNGGKSYKSYA